MTDYVYYTYNGVKKRSERYNPNKSSNKKDTFELESYKYFTYTCDGVRKREIKSKYRKEYELMLEKQKFNKDNNIKEKKKSSLSNKNGFLKKYDLHEDNTPKVIHYMYEGRARTHVKTPQVEEFDEYLNSYDEV